ncbi:hypothetical protein [Methylopila sp. 73B]|uniref:hypothetical protein n=1 Tax=Methylopila sp. 73B TaxID=1120792 RepID=UPI0003650F60|nr:hypothetical protein [Methylopila sp. 73B]
MPPFLVFAAAAAGAVYGAKAIKREWRRINRELEAADRNAVDADKALRPTLRRDPATGEWRPGGQ